MTFQDQHGVTDYDIDGLSEEGSFYYHQILEFSKEMKSVEVILNELWISIFSSFVSRFLVLNLLLLGGIYLPLNKTLTDTHPPDSNQVLEPDTRAKNHFQTTRIIH